MKRFIPFLFLSLFALTANAQIPLDVFGNPDANGTVPRPMLTERAADLVIVNSFNAPTTGVLDLAWDGNTLWVASFNDYTVYNVDPVDGSLIGTIPTELQYPSGLTFDGTNLWVSGKNSYQLHVISPADGTIIATHPLEQDGGDSSPSGLTFDGNNVWINDSGTGDVSSPADSTFMLSADAEYLERYDAMVGYPTGMAWDGEYLWSSDNELDNLNKIDPVSWTIVDQISVSGYDFPNGLTFDGEYLWFSDNLTDMIYQIDISNTATGIEETVADQINVFPNPSVDGRFTFSLSSKMTQVEVEIYNALGQVVMNQATSQAGNLVINLSEFQRGTYFYRVLEEGQPVQSGSLIY